MHTRVFWSLGARAVIVRGRAFVGSPLLSGRAAGAVCVLYAPLPAAALLAAARTFLNHVIGTTAIYIAVHGAEWRTFLLVQAAAHTMRPQSSVSSLDAPRFTVVDGDGLR